MKKLNKESTKCEVLNFSVYNREKEECRIVINEGCSIVSYLVFSF